MTDYASFATDGLRVEAGGGVLRLTLDRPDKRNAVSDEMVLGLIAAVEAAGTDEDIRVIDLRAAGKSFCGGADIVARNEPDGRRPRVGSIQRRVPILAHRIIPLLLQVQVPVVCAVRGWAAGFGCQLALAADFTLATPDAQLWEPFTKRGFTPDSGASWLLPRIASVAVARRMLILGEPLTGTEALAAGMVHSIHESDELDAACDALVQELAAGPTVAIGITKHLLLMGASASLADQLHNEAVGLELSSRSDDFKEGMSAFVQKRPPEFTGR
jgi:2-(1,2-epoxy-1,2-dihydrophenyl)acetyl-CoA isomerase